MKCIKILKKLDYHIDMPKRLEGYKRIPMKIRIEFKDGEYQYIPRRYTFANEVTLTSDELDLISKELKKLNSEQS